MYDLFYVSKYDVDENDWKKFKLRFPLAQLIKNVESLDDIKKKSLTKFFYVVWNDLSVLESFHFDYVVPQWDESYIHVFKNGGYFDGVCIFSKNHDVTEKEFKNRFFIKKKEVDILASVPKDFETFVIDSYEDYVNAKSKSTMDLFWIVPKEVKIRPEFKFNLYFPHHNVIDRKSNHVFKHIFRGEETYTGISLVPKSSEFTQKEIDHRFLIQKKQYSDVASSVQDYDIVFISYNEPNADENYDRLLAKFPRAKRIHGVKGIHQAHIEASKIVDTIMFWVVDGDAEILDNFYFDYEIGTYERDIVHVWRCQNPVNKLIYGYGGVKLLPTHLTLNMDINKPDMTTSISSKFKAVKIISNITRFNTDPYNTWKSAFRECVKLSSKVIDRQKNAETIQRLDIWCTVGEDEPFGKYAIEGAKQGRKYGEENKLNLEEIKKINDFDWLKSNFEQLYGK